MPKTSASSSNAIIGFFWWFHMWGHSVVDVLFDKASNISIWNDFEDMMAYLPWYVGFFFWWAPAVFFGILAFMGLYAIVFAGFFLGGLIAFALGKFVGSGWIRHGQKVMHPVMMHQTWYANISAKLALSKKQGRVAFHATALSKSISQVYNRMVQAAAVKKNAAKARIKQYQDERN